MFAIVEAPSNLGLRPTGVETLPAALLRVGLQHGLAARHAARVEAPPYDPKRDRETRLLNPHGIAAYAVSLANAVSAVMEQGQPPVVLGGDCSIILGPMLALRRRGRFGLLFVDGHTDYYQPEANVNGEAASSELALATGRGPACLTELEGFRPLVRPEDVVALGRRDQEEAARFGSDEPPPELMVLDLAEIRRNSIDAALAKALAHLQRDELAGFWLHVDADVLDDAILPAVEYRLPGGLSFAELETVLRTARATGRMMGFDVTVLNPKLDDGERCARDLAGTIVRGLRAPLGPDAYL
ncbi:MAG TPA: arginase family protein [Polyangia bacterium]